MASKAQIIKEIREEWLENTGADPGRQGAAVILDRMLEAFNEAIAGAGMEYAVRQEPYAARYMENWWVGADYPQGKELRRVMKAQRAEQAAEPAWPADEVDPALTPAGIAPDGLGAPGPVLPPTMADEARVELERRGHVRYGDGGKVHVPGACLTGRMSRKPAVPTEDELTCKACLKVAQQPAVA